MLEEIKSVLHLIIHNIEDWGFFYEYGSVKSLLVIALYGCASLFLSKVLTSQSFRNFKILDLLCVGLIGGCFAFLYLRNINLQDYTYFYPPTTRRIESILGLSVIYGATMAIYYRFYNSIFDTKKILTYICMFAIMTAPLQLWVLFSSSTRDFLRAPILTLLFILISYTIKEKINFTNCTTFYCSALMVWMMTFRQDILIYFPLFIIAIIVFGDQSLKLKLLTVVKLIIFFIPGYLYLTTGFLQSYGNASGRFIPGMSEDVIRTFYGETSFYIGPFNDNTSHLFEAGISLNSFKSEAINFILEYFLRLPTIIFDTYELPLTSNFYPVFFSSTWVGKIMTYVRVIFSFNYFFIATFFLVIYSLRSNKKLLIFLILSLIYLALFNGLQFFTRHIFHLELFSYLILILGSYYAWILSKNTLKFITQKIKCR